MRLQISNIISSFKQTLIKFILFSDGRGLSNLLIYIIVGFSIVILTGITVVIVVCCKRNPNSPDRKKGYVLIIESYYRF